MKKYTAHISETNIEQSVYNHLVDVAEYASQEAQTAKLSSTLYLSGILHDAGKFTSVFNTYIHKAHENPNAVHRGEINHSSAGGKYIFEKYGKAENRSEYPYDNLTAQLISYAVISHHGIIDCISPEGKDKFTERIEPTKEIFYEEAIANWKEYFNIKEIDQLFSESREEIKEIYSKMCETSKKMDENFDSDLKRGQSFYALFAFLQRLILSYLIDADRRDTAEFMCGQKEHRLSEDEFAKLWVDYRNKIEVKMNSFNGESNINRLRNEMSLFCKNFVCNGDGVYRLAIPTGGGKTYASLRYAIHMACESKKKHIYYVAPFLSILEQNARDIRAVLDDDANILEYHSNIVMGKDDTEELKRYELYSESFASPIIMTTMVQLLNIMFDGSTQNIRRMHQLCDSVIIIDEAQSIPVKCISLFTTMINFLKIVCNTTVIMCTATQPLFENVDRKLLYTWPMDIIPDAKKYALKFKRVNIVNSMCNIGYGTEQLADFILSKFDNNILVILNTKAAVRAVYDEIKKRVNGETVKVIQLTTYMCASHRLNVIDDMKSALKTEKIICISTQLIEAGVDVSFETVIRSQAGLDSIIQAAGRCNRNAENSNAYLYVINYLEENISHMEDIKCGVDALKRILDTYHDDLLLPEAIKQYYQKYYFERKASMDFTCKDSILGSYSIYALLAENEKAAKECIDITGKSRPYVLCQAYKKAGREFEVIEDMNTLSIITQYDDNSKKLIEQLCETYQISEAKKLLKELQRYTISIFKSDKVVREIIERHGMTNIDFNEGKMMILDKDFYNNEIGMCSELENSVF